MINFQIDKFLRAKSSLTCLQRTTTSNRSLQENVCTASFCLLPVGGAGTTGWGGEELFGDFAETLDIVWFDEFPSLSLSFSLSLSLSFSLSPLPPPLLFLPLDDESFPDMLASLKAEGDRGPEEEASGICRPGPPRRTELTCARNLWAIWSEARPNILC